ncbi:hypothetical protein ACQP2F_11195 [Actinoplanes sp. CA-030573]|uniref:hypothetical protein n=1 Tax=Actinoplanes sp. CA-030573 TaxID=3239898 RepID=UPI003D90A50A
MQDDLFRPTIQERAAGGPRPWRPDSIFYPAFFGGPLTATTLGLLNGRRLGVARGPMLAIAAAGLLCFAARVVVSAAVGGGSGLRLAGSVSGVLVALVVGAVERRSFRAFLYRGGEPARMVWPGLLAAIGCGLLEAVVIIVAIR